MITHIGEPRPAKYRNMRTFSDGVWFDSKVEAERWSALRMAERAGEISHLRRQVVYELTVNDVTVCRYKADFQYLDVKADRWVVEDVKGAKKNTAEFNLKKKLMLAVHGIEIIEVRR